MRRIRRLERARCAPLPWAGPPLGAPAGAACAAAVPRRPLRPADDRRPLMLRRLVLLALVLHRRLRRHPAWPRCCPQHGATLAERGLLVLFGAALRLDLGRLLDRRDGRRSCCCADRGRSPLMRGLADDAGCGRSTRQRAPRSSCRSATSTCRRCSPACRRRSSRCVAPASRRTSTSTCSATHAIPTSAPRSTPPGTTWRRSSPRERRRRVAGAPRIHYRWRQRRMQAQGRQRRRLLPPLGRALPLHGRARRRQRDDRRVPDHAGSPDGGAPATPASSRRRRARSATRRCTPACSSSPPAPTVRCSPPACSSGSSANRTTGATTRSCAWRPSCAHCALAPLAGDGRAVGRDPVARLRRGGADAPRRLEGLGRRRARRQLRAGAAQSARRAAARPPLVPRQPAELAPDVRAGPASGAPRRVPDRA